MADGTKLLAQNKKARHDFFVEETYEAGISLAGTEVKSIRAGRLNLKIPIVASKMGNCLFWGCTSALMSRGISLIKIPCALAAF